MGLSRSIALAALAAALFMPGAANAGIRIEPMAYDLTPGGLGASHDIRVENTGDQPSPVEIRVERRHILPDGTEQRSPADGDFLVFPPQGIIPPNGFQTFRVQYIGQPVDRTILYTITIAQLPVDTSASGQSGVQFLFNLGTLAAVSPPSSRPEIVVQRVEPASEPGKLRITVANQGNRYTRLRVGRWTLTGGNGATETLEGEPLQQAVAQPLIEPGTERIIELPVSVGFVREGAQARYDLPTGSGR